jgi:hypothetical protein
MKTIFADFNAMTESEHVCLTTRGSKEDMQGLGIQVGDWVWLSDGELVVGARVANDPYYGAVGVPDWRTLVHLDDEGAKEPDRILTELAPLLHMADPSVEDQVQLFRFVTQLEHADPAEAQRAQQSIALRRACALMDMGNSGLALLEIEEARGDWLLGPDADVLYLEILRRTAPERAIVEAEALASSPDVPAQVLVAAINVLAAHADDAPDHEFAAVARRALELCERFEHTHGRGNVSASRLSMVHFNRGMLLLRMGRTAEARRALELAHLIDPLDPMLDEATRLAAYDQHAREIGSRVRSRPLAA